MLQKFWAPTVLKQCILILQILEHLARSSIFSVQYKLCVNEVAYMINLEQQQGDLMNTWHITYSIGEKCLLLQCFIIMDYIHICVYAYITFIYITYINTYDTNVNVMLVEWKLLYMRQERSVYSILEAVMELISRDSGLSP